MIPSWAKVGAKVICVDAAWFAGDYPCPIEEGRIYEISGVTELRDGDWAEVSNDGAIGLWLKGVWNFDHVEGYLSSNRFKPLITKTQEQDIEMFLRIANDTPFHVMIDEELYPID